jgi:flagellar L-ring protein precursor FlgH
MKRQKNTKKSSCQRMSLLGLTLFLSIFFSGCSSLPQTVAVEFPEPSQREPSPPARVAKAPATGSLYQKASYRPAFEDARARLVGDMVTIQIVEKVTASQVSSSTANRASTNQASISAFPFVDPTHLAKLKGGLDTKSGSTFSGDGSTASANTFTGTITATVVEVLPNGHLMVAGDKQIGINQNVDVLRFSGTIDPRLIQPGNLINSTQVANARMESKGRGAQAEAQTVGWLTRFFFSFLPF